MQTKTYRELVHYVGDTSAPAREELNRMKRPCLTYPVQQASRTYIPEYSLLITFRRWKCQFEARRQRT